MEMLGEKQQIAIGSVEMAECAEIKELTTEIVNRLIEVDILTQAEVDCYYVNSSNKETDL